MKKISFFVVLLIVVAVAVFVAVAIDGDRADATSAYALATNQSCATCHDGGRSTATLNATGLAYAAGGYVWPLVTTTTTIGETTTTTAGGSTTSTTAGSTTTTAPTTTSTTLPTGVISVTG